ncbi:glu S.griseus protease inhibitor-like isoform X1 [Cucurbita maxima]|uniref:Glu S.griseus protease inhibitor-like isoform X1 n=1 Tax=Cucurbita maxima TaxID=3661 RepID=A0A6J1JL51_CUCMA|nr:glu S.griseus protease inhibitor-like isoform X1 [Cucurbita maxima]
MALFCRAGKMMWPELLGARGEEARSRIEKENPYVDAAIVREGRVVTLDIRCDRVRVWVNEDGIVTRVPFVG